MGEDVNDIMVSIACLTFNHEQYIREALDSFIMQKTDFVYEIIVSDGGSQDNTRKIVEEYQNKYSGKIWTIFPDVDPGAALCFDLLLRSCKGKYIAICEGDDYWSVPDKLQKQADFLEEHEDFGLVHTELDILFQENKLIQKNINCIDKMDNGRTLSKEELLEAILTGTYVVRTPSVMLRKELLLQVIDGDKFLFGNNFLMGDTPLWVELSRITKFFYLDESTAVYRKNFGSMSRQINLKKKLRFKLSSAELRMYFCLKYNFSSSFEDRVRTFYKRSLFFYSVFDQGYQPMFDNVKQKWLFSLIVQNSLLRMVGKGVVRILSFFKKV